MPSNVPSTMSMHLWAGGPHPWREWRSFPHISLHWTHLPGTQRAVTDGLRHVWFDLRALQVERRCTSRHEQEHIIAGHTGCIGGSGEDRIRAKAAKWLAPDPRHVAQALIEAGGNVHDAADHLWLDEPTMRARLDRRFMHPAERVLIDRLIREELHP